MFIRASFDVDDLFTGDTPFGGPARPGLLGEGAQPCEPWRLAAGGPRTKPLRRCGS
jgi:hypothetical protein